MSPSIPYSKLNDDDELIQALDKLSLESKKLVKSTVHTAPADSSIKIRSWKMNEFKYNVHPSPFPTLARGLFTRRVNIDENGDADLSSASHSSKTPASEDVEGDQDHETNSKQVIVARGYDKFFNMGEVPWNTVSSWRSYVFALRLIPILLC